MIAMIGNALLLALRELRRNVMRSILTMLGIIIGVASVIILVTGILPWSNGCDGSSVIGVNGPAASWT